ncbi:MAG TPA: hypothetical protein VMF09_10370 [Solirubrobacteraceae bacterium]|nr:hypothetical protein [Solirubrobacteraceae bacterium]
MNKHRTKQTDMGLLLALAFALAAAAGVLGTSSAYAGDWMEVSCVNPNQSAAPSENWTSFATGGPGYGSNNGTGCAPGSPMFAILSSAAAAGVGSGENLEYTPPAGSTLIGGSVDVSMYADGGGYNASGTAVAYTPDFAYDSSNVFFQCARGLEPCSNGTDDFSGVLGLPANRGGSFYIGAGCGGAAGYACDEGGSEGAWSLVRLWWANFLLANEATPTGSGVSGTLLSPNAEGTAELTLTAGDPGGPGVYLVTVEIDGKAVYSGTPNNNGGKCVPVGTSGAALMFDYGQPCPASESVDLPINTTTLANGQHTLKVVVQDAAGNSAVVYDGTITTKQPLSGSLGAMPGPGTGASAGSSDAPTGVPNGTTASRTAQLHLGVRSRITRRYARRAVRITGRLLSAAGQPIDGATLEVLQQVSGSPTQAVIAHARTSSNGTFATTAPGGPTRTIEVAYRAFSTEANYAALATIQESVSAGVRLNVAPRRTSPEGTITLSGRVLGPVPAQGVVVELLVHYRDHWEPFRDPRTDSHGRFHVVYQFQGGVGRFPFRALVFGNQSGFPFIHGESGAVDVTTN